MSKTTAIILAAGQGTRMKSALPKVLHEVLGQPMVTRVVERAHEAGAEQAVVVVGYGRELVEARVKTDTDALGIAVEFAVQEQQLGTADAVRSALPAVGADAEDVFILYGDVPNITTATLDALRKHRVANGVTFATMRVDDPTGYGRVERDPDGEVLRIVEHKDCNPVQLAIDEVNAGIYLIPAAFLREHLANIQSSNAQSEFYLTDLVSLARDRGGVRAWIVPEADELAGVNDRSQLAAAEERARALINDAWMKSGVTMQDPGTTRVEAHVRLSKDVILEPLVTLRGRTIVGPGARVGQGSLLTDCIIGSNAEVGPYQVLTHAQLMHGEHTD